MKKLMIAAAGVALVGGAFATDTQTFDYKASVKYVDFKTVNDKAVGEKVWVKVVKSATIKGYLVTPDDCCCSDPSAQDGTAGIYPAFLLVKNDAAKKYNNTESIVKILPANLLSSVWSQKNLATAKTATLEAQGYLMAGLGDAQDEQQQPTPGNKQVAYDFGDPETAATQTLFGEYNIWDNGFWEPFMYHSGFGKATYKNASSSQKNPCVDPQDVPGGICLISLSGTLIGGSFSCMPNGATIDPDADASTYVEKFLCHAWDIPGGANTDAENGNDTIRYNVVSGTWSIKYNAKMTKYDTQAENIVYAGVTLDKKFDLETFDDDGNALNTLVGVFYTKWLSALYTP